MNVCILVMVLLVRTRIPILFWVNKEYGYVYVYIKHLRLIAYYIAALV